MRKPRLSADEVFKASKISPDREAKSSVTSSPLKNTLTYSIEILAQLAMSPLCLTEPDGWDRINQEYPTLIRKVSSSNIVVSSFFVFNLKNLYTDKTMNIII